MGDRGVQLHIDPESLRPLIRAAVDEALAALRAAEAALPAEGKLCYSEAEAARLLGVNEHVLRDERRRGRIVASQIVGRRIRYRREDLVGYLMARRCVG
ncbi:MAG TPA: helix-turn-helix domain-containing protein [Gemmataceae bacterium]